MLTLNQIVQKIEDFQAINLLLKNGDFYFGDPWEFGASGAIQYPFTGCRLISTNLNGNILTTSLNIFCCDKVNKDETNETEVLSDMHLGALRLYSELESDLEDNYSATMGDTPTLTPFTERFDDEVSGVEMNITIEQFYDKSTCN
jgi:hypothetical protein